MKFFLKTTLVTAATLLTFSSAIAAEITGAGSSFVYPIASKWAEAYKKATGNSLNYQSIGSGGGIKQIKANTVDFGASDMPLTVEELDKEDLLQFPVVMGGVVPVVHIDGIKPGQLKLTGQVIADIFLGKVTKWNDPEIAAVNPGIKFPSEDITVVHRSDASGTTFLFSDYLSKVNPEFKKVIGSSTAVKWPAGLGGKGNEGVAANVQRINGSIGYVEFAFAKKNNLSYTQLKNREGQFVEPDADTFKAAAAGAAWDKTPGFAVVTTDQPGKTSWPITGATFVLVHKTQPDAAKIKETLKFIDWSYKNGTAMALELDYIAMPSSVVDQIEKTWKAQIKDGSGKAVW
ncbi:phosphate ABC transporter substrate-binding protein PstS [Undibacterium sp. SXout20W]|uniref:phosphate ABC transporter substrate-binding protein PstS n=1 Tax=Undibacterium sp. SXout20W TaxID=3413051 RepID=UPI003BF31108